MKTEVEIIMMDSEIVYSTKNMSTWKSKKNSKQGKASQTPGLKKSNTCQANPLERWMAKHNRSYKHSLYGQWCRSKNGTRGCTHRVA